MIATIERIVSAGESLLCEAVLLTIFQAHQKSENDAPSQAFPGISASDIGKQAGIYRKSGEVGMNDAIVHGILNKLAEENKVTRYTSAWGLTKTELEARMNEK